MASSDPKPISTKRSLIKTVLTANKCNCRTKLSDVYQPKPKPKKTNSATKTDAVSKPTIIRDLLPSGSGGDDVGGFASSSTSASSNPETSSSITRISESEAECTCSRKSSDSKISSSIAVVTESDDPYRDFRSSILQMVTEREIYSKEDLQELLQCLLRLNSPAHRDVIVRAFMEIWDEIISKRRLQSSHVL